MKLSLLSLAVKAIEIRPTQNRALFDMYEPTAGKEAYTIDLEAPEFERKMDLLVEILYPKLLRDPEFMENEEAIVNEAAELCKQGFDPRNPELKVECQISRSGRAQLSSYKYLTPARKMKQLKIVVLWLQETQEFGKFCYYGCHCMPEGRHNLIGKNWGLPVDDIDRSCKNFFQCYDCARMQDPKCLGDRVKYKYQLLLDSATGDKSITCLNEEGTCQRNICECDKRWANNLQKLAGDFNPEYHVNRSKTEGGHTEESRWKAAEQCKRGPNKYGKPTQCCGDTFPDVMPLQQGKQCCGHKTFDPLLGKQCCAEDRIRNQC